MTFSIAARCARTGQFGCALATSTLAAGSRVPVVQARTGAVLVQFWADKHLGQRGLQLLASGCSAEETLQAMLASTPHGALRQIAVVDGGGRTAAWTGALSRGANSQAQGVDCVAIGNVLANDTVAPAMVRRFEQTLGQPLSDRLLAAIAAGDAAGGEPVPLQSAALLVADSMDFPYVDLRVDRSQDPIAELTSLWNDYGPRADEYVLRVTDPQQLPMPAIGG
jgi:uncharacterized Ntn-hydrolase superfamily protein